MKFKAVHNNFNVTDIEKSKKFYKQALGLDEISRIQAEDDSYTIVFLKNEYSSHKIELTYIKNFNGKYNLGDNEFHLAFEVDDFEKAYNHHKKMNCICYENKKMGIYFISDPDGYWIEIIPST